MDNTLCSLAYITSLWEKKQDIFDTYIPLFCQCIVEYWDRASLISHIQAKEWIDKRYGLSNLTYGAAKTIMSKMVNKGILGKSNGEYKVLKSEVTKNLRTQDIDFEKEITILCKNITEYAQSVFNQAITEESIMSGVMLFVDTYAADLILRKTEIFKEKLEHVRESKKAKYIISRYVIDSQEKGETYVFKILVQIARGYLLTNVVSFADLESFVGNLNNVKIALDAPIIYNLLNLNGDANYKMSCELMDILKKNGAKFMIFYENENEVIQTINDAINRLTSKDYNLKYSSRLLRTAVREPYTSGYLQTKLNELDTLYKQYDIVTEDAPESQKGYQEVDMQKLKDIIVSIYTSNGKRKLRKYLDDTIDIDVDTISYIFRIRGNQNARNLKQSKAILVSTNKAIAYASASNSISKVQHVIPACVTDVFLSTIMWRNFPSACNSLNQLLLMSECYTNVELDDNLFQLFYQELENKYKSNSITKEQYATTATSRLVSSLLEKKTFNDPELFTDMTLTEIIQEVQEDMEQTLQDERDARTSDKEQYLAQTNRDEKHVGRISLTLARGIYWILWICFAAAFILVKGWDIRAYDYLDWELYVCLAVLLFSAWFGLFNHGQIIPSKLRIIEVLDRFIFRRIMGRDRSEDLSSNG